MACTQYTLEQYQVLSDAIATGTVEVNYGDKKVRYRSLDEMIRILELMKKCLFPDSTTGVNSGRKFASFSKGTK